MKMSQKKKNRKSTALRQKKSVQKVRKTENITGSREKKPVSKKAHEQTLLNKYLFGEKSIPALPFLMSYPVIIIILPLIAGLALFYYALGAAEKKPSLSAGDRLARAEAVLNTLDSFEDPLEKQKRLEQAGKEIRQIAREYPYNPNAFIALGIYHINTGSADSAFYSFRKALNLDEGKSNISRNAHNMMLNAALSRGSNMLQKQNYRGALNIIHQALPYHSKNEQLFSMGGYAYRQMGKLDSAAMFFNQILQINPKNQEASQNLFSTLMIMGQNAENRGDFSSAINHFRRAEQLQPENTNLLLKLSEIFMKTNDVQNAQAYRRKALH